MTAMQKGTPWVVGLLTFVFGLSIGLSWYTYGYLDWATVRKMAMMLIPLLAAAVVVMLWPDKEEKEKKERPDLRARLAGRRRRELQEVGKDKERS
ncbi:MAG: hypothetical protein HY716_08450 [Planctomycetes bacterium]|nr:hypothetical protein [Planctomycetota bacterium]